MYLGRVYTSSLKPVFNASLKSRIDEFVTENRIEIHSGTTTRDSDLEANYDNFYLDSSENKKIIKK